MPDDKLSILMYHSLDTSGSVVSVAPDVFRDQMATLARQHIRAVSMREAMRHRAAHGRWPADSAVLTFDDGFANLHGIALPVLAAQGFTATVFLVSSHVGGRNNWAAPPAELGERDLLSWQQVRELRAAGWEIGAHTRTHPDLRCVTPDAARSEMADSKREIADRLGGPVTAFAYPYGGINGSVVAMAAQEFDVACTTRLCRASQETMHRLPRIDMYYLRAMHDMAPVIRGEVDGYLRLRRLGRGVRGILSGFARRRPAA